MPKNGRTIEDMRSFYQQQESLGLAADVMYLLAVIDGLKVELDQVVEQHRLMAIENVRLLNGIKPLCDRLHRDYASEKESEQ